MMSKMNSPLFSSEINIPVKSAEDKTASYMV